MTRFVSNYAVACKGAGKAAVILAASDPETVAGVAK